MHHSTEKAIAEKKKSIAIRLARTTDAPWWDFDGYKVRAFKCQTCGSYILVQPDGSLKEHYWHLVGKDSRKLEEFRCLDNHRYHSDQPKNTAYEQRTATITPA